MLKGLGIKLRKLNRICPIKGSHEQNITIGSPVIVETDRGIEYGEIINLDEGTTVSAIRDVKLKKVLRYAGSSDRERLKEIIERENNAIKIGKEKIREYELPIKIIDVEELFDKTKIIFYYKQFDSNKTVNTRDFAKDVAGNIKIKVEMTLLQPRDGARVCGGLGPCGKALCCSSWLSKYPHVTVKTVKEQGIAISGSKTSGICGRLMCCLKYEHE